MRLITFLLSICLSVACSSAAQAQDLIKYRSADGGIGFAQDRSRVPPGATILPFDGAKKQIQVVEEPVRRASSPARGPASHEQRQERALRQADAEASARRGEIERVKKAIQTESRNLEGARAERAHACRRTSRGGHRFWVDPEGCKRVLSRIRDAEAKLGTIDAWIEEEGLDRDDYFDEEEEHPEGDESREED